MTAGGKHSKWIMYHSEEGVLLSKINTYANHITKVSLFTCCEIPTKELLLNGDRVQESGPSQRPAVSLSKDKWEVQEKE